MARPNTLQDNYDLGMKRDTARDQLPRGAVYNLVDYIPQIGSPLRKRGGWGWASSELAPSGTIDAVAWAPFPSDGHLLAIRSTGHIYQSIGLDATAGTYTGFALNRAPVQRPFYWRDRMVILDPQGATIDPQKYYKSGGSYTVASFGGTPPRATYGCTWGEYVILANGGDPSAAYAVKNNRMWWSPVGNPDGTWSTATDGSFLDLPDEVIGIVPLRSTILVFSWSQIWGVRGTIPPGSAGSDISRTDLFAIGTMDNRSICTYGEYVIFANNQGIWRTDGAVNTDLTEQGGISQYWQELVSGFVFRSGWSAAAGVYRGYFFITIIDPSGINITTLVCDLDRLVWFRFSNIETLMYAQRTSGQGSTAAPLVAGNEELFFGWHGGARAGKLSSAWTPGVVGFGSDADGTPVLPVLETSFYKMGSPSLKRIRKAYINYDLRDGGPLTVGAITSPESTSYTTLLPSLESTTQLDRRPVVVNKKAEGVALRISQENASLDTRLFEIELEGHPLEGSR